LDIGNDSDLLSLRGVARLGEMGKYYRFVNKNPS
jgi:hypothetical protein